MDVIKRLWPGRAQTPGLARPGREMVLSVVGRWRWRYLRAQPEPFP